MGIYVYSDNGRNDSNANLFVKKGKRRQKKQ